MTREEVERVLEEHVMVGRYFEFLPEEDGSERLAGPIRTGRIRAREAGADVLMYSRNSGLVGAILRDARFSAKDKDDVAFYLMRRR